MNFLVPGLMLNERLTLLQPADTPDGRGGTTRTWTSVATVNGRWVLKTGDAWPLRETGAQVGSTPEARAVLDVRTLTTEQMPLAVHRLQDAEGATFQILEAPVQRGLAFLKLERV